MPSAPPSRLWPRLRFASVASVVASAVLLPLVPFHDGHLTALTRLPGNLPSFIVLLLPTIGLHVLATVLPTVPDVVAWTVSLFALVGAFYGAVKALAQTRVRLLLAYGSLSFFSMLWWFAAATRTATPRSALLVGTVGLATSGLWSRGRSFALDTETMSIRRPSVGWRQACPDMPCSSRSSPWPRWACPPSASLPDSWDCC